MNKGWCSGSARLRVGCYYFITFCSWVCYDLQVQCETYSTTLLFYGIACFGAGGQQRLRPTRIRDFKMKKILFALFIAIGTTALFAQDIIITNESIRIDAKILEITDYEVKYMQYGDPNERVFNIRTSSIASIVFENGEVHTFKNNVPPPPPEENGEDLGARILDEFGMKNPPQDKEN